MRLTEHQKINIKRLAKEEFGQAVIVMVFGSRAHDAGKGGDLDLLVVTDDPLMNPALQAARFGSRVERLMNGRKVDVLIKAPSLKELPIHAIAQSTGVPL